MIGPTDGNLDALRRREEDRQRDLGEFSGLEGQSADTHPQGRAVDRRADHRSKRKDQQDDADKACGVGVSLQDAMVAKRQQHQHEQGDADGIPGQLVVDIGCGWHRTDTFGSLRRRDIEAIDHHESEDGQQRRKGQQERVGIRHAPPNDDVCDQRQHADREGDVGRHRHAPAVERWLTPVDQGVDRGRRQHAAQGAGDRQRGGHGPRGRRAHDVLGDAARLAGEVRPARVWMPRVWQA